jgi:hypothetical protein
MEKLLVTVALVLAGLCAIEIVDLIFTMQLYSRPLG